MNVKTLTLAVAVILGCFVAEAAAQDLIFLKDGGVYEGKILSSDEDSVTVSVKNAAGVDETHRVPIEQCEKHFWFQARDKTIGDDAVERIKLAVYCAENDMWTRAKVQMDKARALDPSKVELFFNEYFPKMREGLAQRLMDSANKSFKLGNYDHAKKYISIILTKFEETKVEAEAEALLDSIEAKLDEKANKKAAQRRKNKAAQEASAEKIAGQQIDAYLKPVESLIAQANKDNTRGLKAKSVSKSKGPLEAAAKKYEHAIKKADEALAKGAPDTQTMESMKELRSEAVNGGVQAYLNLANSMSARGSYQKGVAYCNQALALDPNSAEAKSTRQTIASTTAGWGRRR